MSRCRRDWCPDAASPSLPLVTRRRLSRRRPCHAPDGPPGQGRGQSRPPGQPGGLPTASGKPASWISTIRTGRRRVLKQGIVASTNAFVTALMAGRPVSGGERSAHPQRFGSRRRRWRTDRRIAAAVSGIALAPVGGGQERHAGGRRESWLSAAGRYRPSCGQGRRRPGDRERFPGRSTRSSRLCPRFRAATAGAGGGRRRGRHERLYAVESSPTLAGAPRRPPVRGRPDEVEAAVRALAAELGIGPEEWRGTPAWVAPVARDLTATGEPHWSMPGRPVRQRCMRWSTLSTKRWTPPRDPYRPGRGRAGGSMRASLAELVARHGRRCGRYAGDPGSNPVFTAPADLRFGAALGKVPLSVHLGTHVDETAALCTWHVPKRMSSNGGATRGPSTGR